MQNKHKILNTTNNNKLLLTIVLAMLFIGVFMIYSDFAVAQGLIPPEPTTEPYKGQDINQNPIVKWIIFFVNWLSVIIVVGSIVVIAVAGIQYSTAGDDSNKVAEAKKRIINVLVALLSYFFLYAFINWLVPGGIV